MTAQETTLGWVYDDGGRGVAGFSTRAEARDCVARSIAIATDQPYRDVYDALARIAASNGRKRSARDGLPRKVWQEYLTGYGWVWTPTMLVGQLHRVHLVPDELPGGRLVCRLSRHLCAVVDGVVHDTFDPRREGNRLVYGYWQAP